MIRWLPCVAAAGFALPAMADYLDTIGYRDLAARYGTNLATGARVVVGQAEGIYQAGYMPDTNSFSGKTFTLRSGPTGISGHATAVGRYYYGSSAVAPGITNIHLFEATGFLTDDGLRYTSPSSPLDLRPIRVINHSWVWTEPNAAENEDILRRLDYSVDTHGITMAAGVNNGAGSLDYILLAQAYNAIAVGVSGGPSREGPTTADTAGRAKPDIVVPLDLTSWATPAVASSAALLIDRAVSLAALTNAADPRVVKALLLNSAAKLPGWHKGGTNSADDSAVPLDFRYGAGDLRINRAYDLLNAGEVAPGAVVTNSAWDLGSVATGVTNWYFFNLDPATQESLKATLVWHRHASQFFLNPATPTLRNLNLLLYSASGTNPVTRVALSTSAIDNVEHLWVTNFPAGAYALAVAGAGPEPYGLAFDTVPVPLLSLTAADTNGAEFGANPAAFVIRREGSPELPLAVNLSASGTASNGVDYTLPSPVVLTAGQATASITLAPADDGLAEGPEIAVVAIAPGAGYAITPTNQAAVLIADRPVDQWRFENFTAAELADPSISGDAADPDGDGPNLAEYDSAGAPKFFQTGIAGGVGMVDSGGQRYLSLSFARRVPPSDVTNIVEVTSNLVDWAADTVQAGSPAPGSNGTEFVTFRDTVPVQDAARRFIRRRVERLGAP